MSKLDDANLLADVTSWGHAKTQKAYWTEQESTVRARIIAASFPKDDLVEGVNRAALGGPAEGYGLKLTRKIERKVEEATVPTVLGLIEILKKVKAGVALSPEEQAEMVQFGNDIPEPFSTDVLLRTKVELDVKNYKSLSDAQRRVMDNALIIKDASPTLELEVPKANPEP